MTVEKIGMYSSERKAKAYAAASSQASRWSEVWVEQRGDFHIVKGKINPLQGDAA